MTTIELDDLWEAFQFEAMHDELTRARLWLRHLGCGKEKWWRKYDTVKLR
jgi:hypothetical protein